MSELELEPEEHIYKLSGAIIPGCTEVLKAMGAAPTFGFLSPDEIEFYRSRGKAVHKMIELYIRGAFYGTSYLDRRTVGKPIKPYLIGWERFCETYNVEYITVSGKGLPSDPFVEVPLHHRTWRYGVTPDVVAVVARNPGTIELKATSAHSPATEIQTAAQALAVADVLPGFDPFAPRWACRLMDKEPFFDAKVYTDKSHQGVWLSLLNGYNWRKKHKLLYEKPKAKTTTEGEGADF